MRTSLLQALLCLAAASALSAQTTIPAGQKVLTQNGKAVTGVRVLPQQDGTVWFLVPSNDRIVQLQADGVTMKQWQIRGDSDLGANPVDLKVDGKIVWFIENGESLIDAGRSIFARLDTETGQLREWDVPGSRPAAFAMTPDGKVWIPQTNGRLQSVDLNTLDVVDYRSTKTFAYSDMVVGPDGALWLSDFGNNRIVRYEPGALTETSWTFFDPNGGRFNPSQILFDEDGRLWLSMLSVSQLDRFDPATGEIVAYSGFVSPIHFDIFAGRLYVAEAPSANGRIVVMDPKIAVGGAATLTSETLAVGAIPNVLKARIRDSTITPSSFEGTLESFASTDLVTTSDTPGYLRTQFPSTNAYGIGVLGGKIWFGSESLIGSMVMQTIGSSSDLTVPVAAEFGVSPGVRITTDATLYNRGTAGISGEILYLFSPASFAARTTFSVDPGKTILLSDVLGGSSSNSGVLIGPVRVRVISGNPDDLSVTLRSARQQDDGSSFGFSSRAVNSSQTLTQGSVRVLFTGNRTTEASVFGLYTPLGASANAKLLAPDGSVRGQRDFSLAANIAQEFNPAASAFGVAPEPGDVILLSVTSGYLQAYVNVLDLSTLDVAHSPPIDPTDDAIIPDLGTLPGQADTSFVSDLFLANPDSGSDANLAISYLPLGSTGPRIFAELTLPPLSSQAIPDVLGTLFGVTAGQGTVFVQASHPIAVSSRIAARRTEGDYAGFSPALNGGENIGGGETGVAIGVPQTETRRTSLFLYNRGSDGTVTIVGYDGSGNQVGTLSVELASGQAARVSSVMDVLGAGGQAVGRISVSASDGMVLFAQTAEVDVTTGDVEIAKLQ